MRGHTARRSYCKPLAGTPQSRLDPFPQFPRMMWHPSNARIALIRCARPATQLVDKSTAGGQPLVSRHARSGETIVCAPSHRRKGQDVTKFQQAGCRLSQGLRRWVATPPRSGFSAAPSLPKPYRVVVMSSGTDRLHNSAPSRPAPTLSQAATSRMGTPPTESADKVYSSWRFTPDQRPRIPSVDSG